MLALPFSAHCQASIRELRVDTAVTVTDSGAVTAAGEKRGDVVASVQPGFRFERRSANFNVSVDAALDFVTYARNTQPDQILPSLLARSKATLVPQLLFVDASVDVRQAEQDPFGVRAEQGRSENRRTVSGFSVTPYLLHEFSPSISTLVQLAESLYVRPGADATDVRTHNGVARIDLKPTPLGAFAELSRLDNEFGGAADSSLTIDAARAGVTLAASDNVIVGLLVGTERIRLGASEQRTGNVYGATLRWDPAPRTELVASVEHRLYGNGGRLAFRHRTAFTALGLELSREPVTASTYGSTADIGNYLDSILSRSVPDPILRALRVQGQLSTLGLQSTTPSAVDVAADYAQLQTAGNVTWVLSTPRTTITLRGYGQVARQLTLRGATAPVSALTADTRQVGASIEFNRRLDAQMALDTRARWSRIVGLDQREGDVSREAAYRMALVRSLSPRTSATAGLEYRNVDSTVSLLSYGSVAAFVGLNHRF
jgi:uncharacterized protein (PEP-CTERM system associated)